MAASTISRTGVTLTNDTGTASAPNGDGTLLNNAWVQTFLDRIDTMFSGAVTFGGIVSSEGFGTHNFTGSGTGGNTLRLRNTAAGTGNYAGLTCGNDAVANGMVIWNFSSTYTSTALYKASGGVLEATGAGGLSVAATDAAGEIRFNSGGGAVRGKFAAAGQLVLTELTTNAGTSDCASGAAVAIYMKADNLVFALNDGGTMRYLYIPLTGTGTTWSHDTTGV